MGYHESFITTIDSSKFVDLLHEFVFRKNELKIKALRIIEMNDNAVIENRDKKYSIEKGHDFIHVGGDKKLQKNALTLFGKKYPEGIIIISKENLKENIFDTLIFFDKTVGSY